jgi:hypothetical protein
VVPALEGLVAGGFKHADGTGLQKCGEEPLSVVSMASSGEWPRRRRKE